LGIREAREAAIGEQWRECYALLETHLGHETHAARGNIRSRFPRLSVPENGGPKRAVLVISGGGMDATAIGQRAFLFGKYASPLGYRTMGCAGLV
jgi:hypothetical protein